MVWQILGAVVVVVVVFMEEEEVVSGGVSEWFCGGGVMESMDDGRV